MLFSDLVLFLEIVRVTLKIEQTLDMMSLTAYVPKTLFIFILCFEGSSILRWTGKKLTEKIS